MRLNAEIEAARAAGEKRLGRLESAYVSAIRAAGREAAERFSARVTVVAAATPGWMPPDISDVMAFAVRGDRIRGQQRSMLASISGRVSEIPGVSFDVLMPPAQGMLDAVGKRAVDQAGDLRQPIGDAITRGWAEGKSVPDVARDIRSAVNGLAPFRATALARTDLIALSNGAGHEGVRQVNEAARGAGGPPVVRSKTWLSAGDGRVRPTHQEADGQTVPFDQPFNVGGESLEYPGDPAGSDEETMQCRCTEIYNEEGVGAETDLDPEVAATVPVEELLATHRGLDWTENFTASIDDTLAVLGRAFPGGIPMRAKHALADAPGGKLPINTAGDLGPGVHGAYRFKSAGRPIEIRMARLAQNPAETLAHEVGHFLDHTALVTAAEEWGSYSSTKAWQAFRLAFGSTKSANTLGKLLSTETMNVTVGGRVRAVYVDKEYLNYLLDSRETWARAFAQYMATKHAPAGSRLRLQFEARRREDGESGYPAQWSDEDFEKLVPAIEAVLRENGLLPASVTAAGHRQQVDVRPLAALQPLQKLARGLLVESSRLADVGDEIVVRPAVGASSCYVDHAANGIAASSRPMPDVPSEVTPGGQMSVVEAEQAVGTRWISDIAFEGLSTGDGRFMVPGSLGWRDLPLTLMAMIETPEFGGHAGAQVAGRMDTMTKDSEEDMDGEKLPEGVAAVRSTGEFDIEGDRGSETARMVDAETMRGISVDLAVHEWAFRDPETGELIDPEEATEEQWERAFMGELEFAVVDGEIMAATVCPTPAFADARIAILASSFVRPKVWRLSAEGAQQLAAPAGQLMTTLYAEAHVVPERTPIRVVTASVAPVRASRDWFMREEPDGPCPQTITDKGEYFGHLALWETCHTGYINGEWSQCVKAPRSQTGYAHFHLGEYITEEGDSIDIGTLTFDTGHAPINLGRVAARKHYDDTGAVGALVRVKDGEHGIWACGVLPPDITEEELVRMRACPPSGDWRSAEHNLELIGALAVPTPGFPVPRAQFALAASAVPGELEVTALILTASIFPTDTFGGVQIPVELYEYEGAALDAVIAGGAEGLAALIEG